jgi:hypothetical protein
VLRGLAQCLCCVLSVAVQLLGGSAAWACTVSVLCSADGVRLV